jgi:hypothetical protein
LLVEYSDTDMVMAANNGYGSSADRHGPVGGCCSARQPFGRITIANFNAAAAVYTDQAIDQAFRAVQELLSA